MQQAHLLLGFPEIDAELRSFSADYCSRDNRVPRELRDVLDCIHRNLFDSDLTVQALKARCRIRDNNISCRFRYTMGITIKDYIESLRMEAAGKLLKRPEVNIFDIALSVGYCYPQAFYRAFKKKFRCTPGRYRREALVGARLRPPQSLPEERMR